MSPPSRGRVRPAAGTPESTIPPVAPRTDRRERGPVVRDRRGRRHGRRRTGAGAGVAPERAVVLGFSQGGCLAAEYVARRSRRYGGLVVLSGPEGATFEHTGDLAGMPISLGCSDVDPHVPAERVHESRDVLEWLGGDVTERIYPGTAHAATDDEVAFVRILLDDLVTHSRNEPHGDDATNDDGPRDGVAPGADE